MDTEKSIAIQKGIVITLLFVVIGVFISGVYELDNTRITLCILSVVALVIFFIVKRAAIPQGRCINCRKKFKLTKPHYVVWAKIHNDLDDKKEEIGFTFCQECMDILYTKDKIISSLDKYLEKSISEKIDEITIQKYF